MLTEPLALSALVVITVCQLLTLWMLYDCHRLAHNGSESHGIRLGSITDLLDEAVRIGADIADGLDGVIDGSGGGASPGSPMTGTGGSMGEVLTTLVLNHLMPDEQPHGTTERIGTVHEHEAESPPESADSSSAPPPA
jgi:hypothetical protein